MKMEFSYLYMTWAALAKALLQPSPNDTLFSVVVVQYWVLANTPVRRSLKPSDEYRQLRRAYFQESVLNNKWRRRPSQRLHFSLRLTV